MRTDLTWPRPISLFFYCFRNFIIYVFERYVVLNRQRKRKQPLVRKLIPTVVSMKLERLPSQWYFDSRNIIHRKITKLSIYERCNVPVCRTMSIFGSQRKFGWNNKQIENLLIPFEPTLKENSFLLAARTLHLPNFYYQVRKTIVIFIVFYNGSLTAITTQLTIEYFISFHSSFLPSSIIQLHIGLISKCIAPNLERAGRQLLTEYEIFIIRQYVNYGSLNMHMLAGMYIHTCNRCKYCSTSYFILQYFIYNLQTSFTLNYNLL